MTIEKIKQLIPAPEGTMIKYNDLDKNGKKIPHLFFYSHCLMFALCEDDSGTDVIAPVDSDTGECAPLEYGGYHSLLSKDEYYKVCNEEDVMKHCKEKISLDQVKEVLAETEEMLKIMGQHRISQAT